MASLSDNKRSAGSTTSLRLHCDYYDANDSAPDAQCWLSFGTIFRAVGQGFGWRPGHAMNSEKICGFAAASRFVRACHFGTGWIEHHSSPAHLSCPDTHSSRLTSPL